MGRSYIQLFLGLLIALFFISSAEATDFNFGSPILLSGSLYANAHTHPQIATDGLGTWICVWDANFGDGTNPGGTNEDSDIIMTRSTDNGTTWTIPVALNTNAATDSGEDLIPGIATDGQGHWVVVWRSYGTFGSGHDIVVAHSADNGATWTEPSVLFSGGINDFARVATDGAGHWIVVWYSNNSLGETIGTDLDILVAHSADNGATWTSPTALNINAGADLRNDAEPKIISDRAGLWIAVWRSTIDPGGTTPITDDQILVARSTDNGSTWTEPTILNSTASPDEGRDQWVQAAADGAGNLLVVWESSDPLGDTIGADSDVLVVSSTDYGENWSTPTPLNTDAATDSHLDRTPDVATDATGNWVAVWNFGGYIAHSLSTDTGGSWTSPEQLDDNAISGDGRPQVAADGNGTWITAWLVEENDPHAMSEIWAAKALTVIPEDSDGDGVPDSEDECDNSDLSPTIVIDGCDSGVDNVWFDDGCTISDRIAELASSSTNHGKFTSAVSHYTNDLKKDGVISGKQKGAIQSCAGQAGIP